MKKVWLLGPFILSMSLFGQETDLENSEISRRPVIGQMQKKNGADKNGCASCCNPQMNYRLPGDFWGVDTFVEYLLWQVQEQGSQFAATPPGSPIDVNYPEVLVQGQIQSERFNWNSGVRVGFGYFFGRDVWQLLGEYTWYAASGKSSYSLDGPFYAAAAPVATEYLEPLLQDNSLNGVTTAAANAHFSYQMANLLLASAFLSTKQIQFNYSFGATGGYIKENFNVDYYSWPSGNVSTANTNYHHNTWNFGGGGFRAGVDTNWHMGYGFGFFGKLSFAAILGQYTNQYRITQDLGASGGSANDYHNATYQAIMLLPTSQFVLGFDWARIFSNCTVSAVRVSIAGEFNYLSDLQNVFKSYELTLPTQTKPLVREIGSVFMYGGTARLGVDY